MEKLKIIGSIIGLVVLIIIFRATDDHLRFQLSQFKRLMFFNDLYSINTFILLLLIFLAFKMLIQK
ncbi:hypothetical protein KJ992_00245 [Patescibacteria group bacterium]|nr:hypothetical protein [Patescibacteria group bacterium]